MCSSGHGVQHISFGKFFFFISLGFFFQVKVGTYDLNLRALKCFEFRPERVESLPKIVFPIFHEDFISWEIHFHSTVHTNSCQVPDQQVYNTNKQESIDDETLRKHENSDILHKGLH